MIFNAPVANWTSFTAATQVALGYRVLNVNGARTTDIPLGKRAKTTRPRHSEIEEGTA